MRTADKPAAKAILTALLSKAKAGTVKGIYKRLEPDEHEILRYVLNPAGTDTGRLACADTFLEPSTNLQNLPNKVAALDPLYRVRDVIFAPQGRLLGEIDGSQAEARVGAYMSQDPLAMWQYENGIDRYRALASELYAKKPEDVTKMERQVGKMGQLAFQFCVQWKTFLDQVNADADITGVSIDAKMARRCEDAFHAMHPRYKPWWEEILGAVLKDGYLVNPFGRKRYFFGRRDSQSAIEQLKRSAVAFMPQSTIADLVNDSIVRIYERHDPSLLWIHLQVHDALLFSCEQRNWFKASRAVKEAFEERTLLIHGREIVIPAEVELSKTSWSAKKVVNIAA